MSNAEAVRRPQGNRRRLLIILGVVVAVGAVIYGLYWLLYARYFESTDDAYVGGNIVADHQPRERHRAGAACRQHPDGAARPAADRDGSRHRPR